MVQWARELAVKPNDLSLIHGAHRVEGEHRLPQSMHRTQEASGAHGIIGSLPHQTSSKECWEGDSWHRGAC